MAGEPLAKEADVPNGIYPVPILDADADSERSRRPSPWLRLRTWWMRGRLDEHLARGADPQTSRDLEHRAAQLCTSHARERLARALENVSREAYTPVRLTVQVPTRRAAVRACATELEALVRRLRDGMPVNARGAALTQLLLTDGTGPLYQGDEASLRAAITSAQLALDVRDPADRPAPIAA
jgi:hypothetical protein